MLQIKLIVTGDLEKLALVELLRQLFPSERKGQRVVWDRPRKLHGATSHRLVQGSSPSQPMLDLARAMLDEAGIGKTGRPADLVIVIDDVELGNLAREEIVAQHFRAAVNQVLSQRYKLSEQQHYRETLRENCSFHLLKPMVESYFFGDIQALGRAGVPADASPMLVHSDVEEFESSDPRWLPACQMENAQQQLHTPWWNHERHPKHYLEHLTARGGVFYEEKLHGKDALISLRWTDVPKALTETIFARSLFEDLSFWFDVPNPLGRGSTHAGFYPSKSARPTDRLLRNL